MRKNPWLENSKKNLLPLSESGDFKNAQKEWEFSGDVIDYGAPEETCELCEHEKLRYHYEIKNNVKSSHLWVGSSCILRFQDIVVYNEDGVQLTEEYLRRQELEKALREKQVDLALQPLRKLWKDDRNYRNYIESNVDHFKEKGAFLPQGLSILCARMKSYRINYKTSMFPVYLRTIDSKVELSSLKGDLLENVKECLSSQQRKRFFPE